MYDYDLVIGTGNYFTGTSSHEIFLLQDLKHCLMYDNLAYFDQILDYIDVDSFALNNVV